MNKKYKTAAEAIAAMQAREQAAKAPRTPAQSNDEAFFAACANMDHVALRNDPRAKAYDAKTARREGSFYRDGGR